MSTNNSLKSELITDTDFHKYLSDCLLNLPSKLHASKVTQIEDISGNVNRVKRISFDDKLNSTLVVKHVPKDGKLAKYPSISFASDRLEFENKWFNHAKDSLIKLAETRIRVPDIIFFDKSMRLLIMEDLGTTSFSSFLINHQIECNLLLNNLGITLANTHNESTKLEKVNNLAASQNRPYIFSFHLTEPATVTDIWKSNYSSDTSISLEKKIKFQSKFIDSKSSQLLPVLSKLEKSYLDCAEPVFTHGDLHTKSIIVSKENNIGIIDAELSNFGDRAFDIGFLSAHLVAELTSLDAPFNSMIQNLIDGYLTAYRMSKKENIYLFKERVVKFLGAEMLRRLMGPAGFNVNLSIEQFEHLTSLSYDCLLNPDIFLKRLTKDSY